LSFLEEAIAGQTLRYRQRMWSVYGRGIERYFACHLDPTEVKLLVKILDRMTVSDDSNPEN
jgi:hypothetical protein